MRQLKLPLSCHARQHKRPVRQLRVGLLLAARWGSAQRTAVRIVKERWDRDQKSDVRRQKALSIFSELLGSSLNRRTRRGHPSSCALRSSVPNELKHWRTQYSQNIRSLTLSARRSPWNCIRRSQNSLRALNILKSRSVSVADFHRARSTPRSVPPEGETTNSKRFFNLGA